MSCKYPSLTNKNIESELALSLEDFFNEKEIKSILSYFDNKEFISDFGDYKSYFLSKDSNLGNFFDGRIHKETGEPRLFFDKYLNRYFFIDKFNERIYYPLNKNGLNGIFTSNEIKELSESLSLMLAKEYNLTLNGSDVEYEFKNINLREFISEKLNALSDRLNDSDLISDMDKADQVADSLDHLDEWVKTIKSYYASQKILFEESEYIESENLEEEETEQKGFGGRKESFTKSYRTNMLGNVKMFLSLIEDTKKNSFGLYRYIPFEDVYSTLFKTLSDTFSIEINEKKDGKLQSYENMYDVYLEKIKELEGVKPYIKNLIDKLENPEIANDTFKNQFVSAFFLFKKNFLGSEFSINNDGTRVYSIMNLSESSSRKGNILNTWYDNFLKINSDEKLDDAINSFKRFNQDFNLNWKKYNEEDFQNIVKSVSKVLSDIGITTSPEGLNYYLNDNTLSEKEFDYKLKKISKLMNNVIYKRIITPYLDPKKRPLLFNENVFKSQSSELGQLSQAEAFFMEETSDASIYTLGKTKWAYSNPSFLDLKIAEWKKNPEALLKHYESNIFHKNSYIIKYLLGMSESNGNKFDKELSLERLKNVEIGIFNSLQEENDSMNASEGKDISYTDSVVDFIHKTLGTMSSSTGGKSWFKTALAADKSTEYQINYGVDLVKANARYENNEYKIDERPTDIILGYFIDEYNRMNKTAKEIKSGKNLYPNYHLGGKNGLKSQLFPEISPVFDKNGKVVIPSTNLTFSLFDKNGYPSFENLSEENKKEIKEVIIKPILIQRIKELNDMFISENIIGYNKDGVLINNSIDKNLFESYYNESSKNVSKTGLKIAGDLFINGIISQVEYAKLFTGDVAYYKSSIDYRKRVPATYTDGLYLNVFNKEDIEFNVAVIENVEIDEPSIEYLKEYTSEEVWSQFTSKEGERKPIDSTDAQAWISHNRWKFLLDKMGKWTKEHDEVWTQMQKEIPVYTEAQKKLIAQPLKGVYFDNHNGRPVFLKYSQAVLVPNLVRNAPDLSRLLSKMQSQKIDEIVTLSGIKVGMIEPIKIHDENGKLLNDFKLNKMPLNNRFWKLQQDLPTKGIKLTDLGSQIQKNIFQALAFNLDTSFTLENGKEFSGDEMIDLLNSLSNAILYKNKDKVFNQLGIDPNTYEIKNVDLLYSEIIKQLEDRRDVPENIINGFRMGLSPYGIPGGTELFQNVFSSIINNKINKIKTNGGGFIQMADFGLTKSEATKTKGIKFAPWFLEGKDERATMPQFVKDENGNDFIDPKTGKKKMVGAGIFIPANLISKYIPDYQKYSTEELFGKLNKKTNNYEGGIIDQDILSNIVGYRIPNQGLVSNDAYRVIGILPESMGDAVITYAGITKKTGSDFDIDKLYLMIPSYNFDQKKNKLTYVKPRIDENGNFIDLNKMSEDELRNLLINSYKSILLQGEKETMDKIFKPLDLDFFQRDIDNLNPARKEGSLNLFNPIDDISTKIKYKTSKAGLGVAVNNTMDFVRGSMGEMFLSERLPWGNHDKIKKVTLSGKIIEVEVSKLDAQFSESLSDEELDFYIEDFNSRVSEDKKIKGEGINEFKRKFKKVPLSDTFTALTNAFVDVANNPFIVEGNWVNQTNNMAFMLVRAGVHPFKINAFLNQPIIKEFVSYKNNIESKSVEGNRNPVMGFKIKKIAENLSSEESDIITIREKSFTPKKLFYSLSKELESIQYVNINSIRPNNEADQYDYDNFKKKIEKFKSSLTGKIVNRFNLINRIGKEPQLLEQVESIKNDLVKVLDEIIFTEAVKFENITLKTLRKQNIPGELDVDVQESVINKYLNWTQSAKSVSKSVSASRTDVDGKGKNITSLIVNINKVKEAMMDENLIGFETKYSRKGKRTALGSSLDLSLKIPSKIMESNPKFFAPYNKGIINTFNMMSEETKGTILLNEKLGDELNKAYTTYLLSGFEPFRLTNKEKKELIDSMPNLVKSLQKKYPDNKFLQELYLKESELIKDKDGNSIDRKFQVGISNSKKSVSVINSIIDGFRDLIDLDQESGEKLIQYAFLTSGGVKTSNSFYEYIPYEWFNKNRFNQYLKNQLERESEHESIATVNASFARQFMRSNLKNRSLVPVKQIETFEDDLGRQKLSVSVPSGAKSLGLNYFNVLQSKGPDLPPYISFEKQFYDPDGVPTFKFKGYYERVSIVTNSNNTTRGVYVRTTPLGIKTKTGARVLEYDIFNKRTVDIENESIFEQNKEMAELFSIDFKNIAEYIKSNPDNLDYSTGAFGAMSLISEHSLDEMDKLTPKTDTPQSSVKKIVSNAIDKNIDHPVKQEVKTPLSSEENIETEEKQEKTINVYWGQAESETSTRILSNLAPRKFIWEGREYGSVEHAYQSNKSGTFDKATYDAYNKIPSISTNIPQNKVSGIESYGFLIEANNEVKSILGNNPHSIDMIEAGLRTRTTRSESEMAKYAIKVGDTIKHFGKSADGTTKTVYTIVTAIHPKGSAGWKNTWEKEGWRKEDSNVIDRFKDGAAAIEFEVVSNFGYGKKIKGKGTIEEMKAADSLGLMKKLVVESFKQNPNSEATKKLLEYKKFTHNTNQLIDKAFLEGLELAKKELKNIDENLDNSKESVIFTKDEIIQKAKIHFNENKKVNDLIKKHNLNIDFYTFYSVYKELVEEKKVEEVDEFIDEYFEEYLLYKSEEVEAYVENIKKMPKETDINLDFYSVAFNYPYIENSDLDSLGKYNEKTGIQVRPNITIKEFINYIEGKDNKSSSKQKEIVFNKLINEKGYSKEEILKLFKTEDDIKAFIVFHEISHLENNDLKKLKEEKVKFLEKFNKEGEILFNKTGYKLTEEDAVKKWNETRPFFPSVIDYETRATEDAITILKKIKDNYKLFLKERYDMATTSKDYSSYLSLALPNFGLKVEEFKNYLKDSLESTSQLGFDFREETCN